MNRIIQDKFTQGRRHGGGQIQKLFFEAKSAKGWDPGTVKKNLAALLKQDASGIARLFSGESRVIKSGLSRGGRRPGIRKKSRTPGAVCQVLVDEEVGTDLKFKCPNCQKVLKVKAELGGKMVKCPSCGQGLVVPAAGSGPRTASDTGYTLRAGTRKPGRGEPAADAAPRAGRVLVFRR